MQTFLPFPSFSESASVLDDKRLGKQRVECKQILQALQRGKYTCKHCGYCDPGPCPDRCSVNVVHSWRLTAWKNHPAVKMWEPVNIHTIPCLAVYGIKMCREWKSRGYKDTLEEWFRQFVNSDLSWELGKPSWIGDESFHRSHRSNLLRKLPEHYAPLFESDLSPDLPYVWPTNENK